MNTQKRLAILGSTGSIGRQTLEVVDQYPDLFEAYLITANNQIDLLIEQARKYRPEVVIIANKDYYTQLRDALADLPIKVYAGADAIADAVTLQDIDIVVTAMVGYAGLQPTIRAIEAKKTIALANKETLVVAGELITQLALQHHAPIIPVDSEHSAMFGRRGQQSYREDYPHSIGRSIPQSHCRATTHGYSCRCPAPPQLEHG